jgi:hypothetical protein
MTSGVLSSLKEIDDGNPRVDPIALWS